MVHPFPAEEGAPATAPSNDAVQPKTDTVSAMERPPPQAREDPPLAPASPENITAAPPEEATKPRVSESATMDTENSVEPMDISSTPHEAAEHVDDKGMEIDQETLDALVATDEQGHPTTAAEEPTAITSNIVAPLKVELTPINEAQAPTSTTEPQTTLEQLYAPYLLPEETSLAEARQRLRMALEQTRLLRESFTEQVYERYGVVLQPIPTTKEHNDRIKEIIANPRESKSMLILEENEKKKERERCKIEAANEGENDPLASFGGDGLQLVILPEQQHQSHHDKKRDTSAISAASAAATDVLLDKVRLRRGLAPLGTTEYYEPEKKRRSGELKPDRSLNSSPSVSVDSNLGQQPQQVGRKAGYSSLLTLTPSGETLHKSKKYPSQYALLSKGVGISEMKRDPRTSTLVAHQRVIPKEFYETALPQLVGARQVGRRERRRVEARRAIRSVIGLIMEKEKEDERLVRSADSGGEGKGKGDGNDDKDGGGGGGSSEIGLMHRLQSLSDQHHERKSTSDEQDKSNNEGEGKPSGDTTADLAIDPAIDPLLAYSVMSAVGLVQTKHVEIGDKKSPPEVKDSGNSVAKMLGLSGLMKLGAVSDFVKSFSPVGAGNKRKQADDESQGSKVAKIDVSMTQEKGDVLHIRGGGEDEDEKKKSDQQPLQRDTSHSAAAPAQSNANLTPTLQNQLFQQQAALYNLNQAAAMGSLQSPLDPYQSAALAHQLGMSMGAYPISAPAAPDLSDFYLRSQLAERVLIPGQLKYSLQDQREAVTAMLLREQQQHAAAAHYQAALSTLAGQNPYAAAYAGAMSLSRQPATAPAAAAAQADKSPKSLQASIDLTNDSPPAQSPQRKRARSLSNEGRGSKSPKRSRAKGAKGKHQTSPVTRPSSAPVQPAPVALPNAAKGDPPLLPNVSRAKAVKPHPPVLPSVAEVITIKAIKLNPSNPTTIKAADSQVASTELHFAPPDAPQGLSSELAQLIIDGKFYEALAVSKEKPGASEDLLIEYLLSLAAAVPIPRVAISDALGKKLSEWKSLKEFICEITSDIIVATIAVCLWAKHESYFKRTCIQTTAENADSSVVITFAVDKALSALSSLYESCSSENLNLPKGEIASVVNKSLLKRVVIDKQMDASLPLMDDMLGLVDSLRMEALKAKVQERVLLATLVSRHGKMSEAFSNAYVSAIIRAGEALGHEEVCEIAQDEKCRASTMLPYDFFHDHTGLWEEPCRPPLGVHPDTTGKELKRRAHAKTIIQKSMKKLQICLGLKGGISDGGPFFSEKTTGVATPSPAGTPTAQQAVLVRTNSSNLKRKGSQTWDTTVMPGTGITGVPDSIFNPGHWIAPMAWDADNSSNTPYGRHQVGIRPSILSVGGSMSESRWKKLERFPLALRHRSTHEVKWEDVADMFLHGGSTRKIVLDLGGDSGTKKKNIVAPFVRSFDVSALEDKMAGIDEEYSDEDISDETVLQRHQKVLDDMMEKVNAYTEMKNQQPQSRGRKKA